MKRSDALPYVSFVVDDAGYGRELHADRHAIVRSCRANAVNRLGEKWIHHHNDFEHRSVLVGWQCGFEPLFVAVHSYLDVRLDESDACDMAQEYLDERGWIDGSDRDHEPDHVIGQPPLTPRVTAGGRVPAGCSFPVSFTLGEF